MHTCMHTCMNIQLHSTTCHCTQNSPTEELTQNSRSLLALEILRLRRGSWSIPWVQRAQNSLSPSNSRRLVVSGAGVNLGTRRGEAANRYRWCFFMGIGANDMVRSCEFNKPEVGSLWFSWVDGFQTKSAEHYFSSWNHSLTFGSGSLRWLRGKSIFFMVICHCQGWNIRHQERVFNGKSFTNG